MQLNNLTQFDTLLFLQGPVGPFFSHLTNYVHSLKPSISLHKVNLCAGDQLFFHPRAPCTIHSYTQQITEFDSFLQSTIRTLQTPLNPNIAVVIFGDCRPYHRIAFSVLQQHFPTIQLITFEEGYFRPHYLTMEFGRVNGHSAPINFTPPPTEQHLPIAFSTSTPTEAPHPTDEAYPYQSAMARYGALYAIANTILNPIQYPHYKNWREMPISHMALKWASFHIQYNILRKNSRENTKTTKWAAHNPKQYFVLALQLAHDSQIRFHSNLSQESFLSAALRNFANKADPNHHLIIKAHPLDVDPAYWKKQIDEQVWDLHIQNRVHFITEASNTQLLQNSLGLLCINSTLGLAALDLNIPLFCAGRAVYSHPKLTPNPLLESFFQHPIPPHQPSFISWKQALIQRNQVPGNVYAPLTPSHPPHPTP